MKTIIFTIKYNLDTNFSKIFHFLHYVKSVQIPIFFWSVFGHFSRCVVIWFSALRDNCSVKLESILWYVSLTNYRSQEILPVISFPRKYYSLEKKGISSILKTGSWQLFCKGTFVTGESDSTFSMCSFLRFVPRI